MTHAINRSSNEIVLAVIISVVLLTILVLTLVATWHIFGGPTHLWHAIADDVTDAGRRTLSF
jgi:hypothetical protein